MLQKREEMKQETETKLTLTWKKKRKKKADKERKGGKDAVVVKMREKKTMKLTGCGEKWRSKTSRGKRRGTKRKKMMSEEGNKNG